MSGPEHMKANFRRPHNSAHACWSHSKEFSCSCQSTEKVTMGCHCGRVWIREVGTLPLLCAGPWTHGVCLITPEPWGVSASTISPKDQARQGLVTCLRSQTPKAVSDLGLWDRKGPMEAAFALPG